MKKLINLFKKKKSLPLDEFIDMALYDKKIGYYMKKNPFGKKGDYITSPLISNLFSEMIAVWSVALWESLKKPKKICIVELGPGDGTLCQDLINTFKNFKDFYPSFEIKLFEKSTKLRLIQKTKIKSNKVKWIKNINKLNHGPIIFLCNEFFDSLPIKQFYVKKKIFFERHVILKKNKKDLKFIDKKAKKNLIHSIKKLNLDYKANVIEYPIAAIKYLDLIAKKIKKHDGALLSIDYGYNNFNSYNSLQSVKKHKKSNILKDVGNSDITHHINYKLFLKVLKKNNLNTEDIVTQSKFLKTLGILERANILSKKISFKSKANMYFRLRRILSPTQMGGLFKVLMAQKKGNKFSLGFK